QQREYPWGADIDSTFAAYECLGDGSAGCSVSDLLNVGSRSPKGDANWGQSDMAGNLAEWTLDWLVDPYSINPCLDCANWAPATTRVTRGGAFNLSSASVHAAVRSGNAPSARSNALGARCAREP